MIRYALVCAHEHGFEGWFGSSTDYDDQSARGLVECPICRTREVRKQIMAPAVVGRSQTPTAPASEGPPRAVMMEALGKLRRHVKETFDYVGDAFATEARAIHEGTSDERNIYGEARPEEVRALVEDGVRIAPLPPDPTELN